MKTPIKFNDVQRPISLASKNYINGGKRGIVSGWGRTKINGPSSEILRWLSVNVLSQESCLLGHKNPRTNENHICTLEKIGKGACQVSIFLIYVIRLKRIKYMCAYIFVIKKKQS